MLREIVLDTETTGTDPLTDRIVEIGGIELVGHVPTGRFLHLYVNPGRSISEGALAVHGLSEAFLADKPRFEAIAEELLGFVDGARLVIHNAAFDIAFLDAELARAGRPGIGMQRALDTLALARRKHPGAPNNLDALCARYGVDNSRRTKHGALLDAELLAEVYIELIGGKQIDLGLAIGATAVAPGMGQVVGAPILARARPSLPPRLTEAERAAHLAFMASLGEIAIWRDYVRPEG